MDDGIPDYKWFLKRNAKVWFFLLLFFLGLADTKPAVKYLHGLHKVHQIDLAPWLGFLDERKFIINQIVILIEIHFLQIETSSNLKA